MSPAAAFGDLPAKPTDDADVVQSDVERLGDAIAELAARIHAATYELLVLVRTFDAASGWNGGFQSCAHWLSWRTGVAPGAAREKVRVARALAALPVLSAGMQRGELSYAKVRAITRIATPDNEARLVALARCGTAAHVERLVRAWRRVDQIQAARETARRHAERELTTWIDDDGMVNIRGRLTPELGAVVRRAIEAASDRLFREAELAPAAESVSAEVTPVQLRADALGLVAEAALAAGMNRGAAGDRYQVVLHVDADVLKTEPLPDTGVTAGDAGQAVLEDGGTYVSAETSRRLACDAAVVAMRHARDGALLDVGRKTRTIPPAIRRALAARDRQCRFPGCTARHCDAHHLTHWADGGPTSLDNLVLLCRRHHRAVHEEGWTIARSADDGGTTFVRPDGRPLESSPRTPEWSAGVDPLAPVNARLRAAHIVIGPHTATPHWTGEPLDVAWAIDVLWTGSHTGDDVDARSKSLPSR